MGVEGHAGGGVDLVFWATALVPVNCAAIWLMSTVTAVVSSGTTPALVFSNTSATRANLTAPAITALKTFPGSGRDIQTNLTIGYLVRF